MQFERDADGGYSISMGLLASRSDWQLLHQLLLLGTQAGGEVSCLDEDGPLGADELSEEAADRRWRSHWEMNVGIAAQLMAKRQDRT